MNTMVTHPSMYKTPQVMLFLIAFLLQQCAARTWVTVVDPTIYASAAFDPYRAEHITESSPFFFPTEPSTTNPFLNVFNGEGEGTNSSPTRAPAMSTPAPTARDEKVLDNGGCGMDEYLYKVRMHDIWGDGWDKTSLKIFQNASKEQAGENAGEESLTVQNNNETDTISEMIEMNDMPNRTQDEGVLELIFEGTLQSGPEGYSYVCLKPRKCYEVVVGGGLWENEIKWDIRSSPVSFLPEVREKETSTIAKGWAPAHCQFSILDQETGELECPFSCDLDSAEPLQSSKETASGSPSLSPTGAPTLHSVPSDAPSLVPTLEGSTAPSGGGALGESLKDFVDATLPSDMPSLVPSVIPSLAPSPSLAQSDKPSIMAPSSLGPKDDVTLLGAKEYATIMPSDVPSDTPSDAPSDIPSSIPSDMPSTIPTLVPSTPPSSSPSLSAAPTDLPTPLPTDAPSDAPSDVPTDFPSLAPSVSPSLSTAPTDLPSLLPSDAPTDAPSGAPTDFPSLAPSASPSSAPSSTPSFALPSDEPSLVPSIINRM
jgi:hypothetical protein